MIIYIILGIIQYLAKLIINAKNLLHWEYKCNFQVLVKKIVESDSRLGNEY